MKAINRPFTEIINGNRQFIIPVFQRNFSWTREQCEQLWRDVRRANTGEADGAHFLGSIVYIGADLSSAAFSELVANRWPATTDDVNFALDRIARSHPSVELVRRR